MQPRSIIGFVLAAAAIPFASSGCGSAALEPIEVALGCPEQPLRGPGAFAGEPADVLIDDFEDGNPELATAGGRDGAWILGVDPTEGVATAEESSHCAARGRDAGHFTRAGFTSWGANWTAVFRATRGGLAVPHDASGFGGISFWAAHGPGAEPPFELPVGVTTIDNAWNGGVCNGSCMDYYGTRVSLTSRWQRFDVRFEQLAQNGWGEPQVAMRRNVLVGFIIWPDHASDIWIDDVRFER